MSTCYVFPDGKPVHLVSFEGKIFAATVTVTNNMLSANIYEGTSEEQIRELMKHMPIISLGGSNGPQIHQTWQPITDENKENEGTQAGQVNVLQEPDVAESRKPNDQLEETALDLEEQEEAVIGGGDQNNQEEEAGEDGIPVQLPEQIIEPILDHATGDGKRIVKYLQRPEGKVCVEHRTLHPDRVSWNNHVHQRHSGVVHCAGCRKGFLTPGSVHSHVKHCNSGIPTITTDKGTMKFPCFKKGCKDYNSIAEKMIDHLNEKHPGEFDIEDYRSGFLPYVPQKRVREVEGDQGSKASKPKRIRNCYDPELVRRTINFYLKMQPLSANAKNSNKLTKEEAFKMFPIMGSDEVVKVSTVTDPDLFGFPGTLRIVLKEFGLLRQFPTFVTLMTKSGFTSFGGAIVKPPPNHQRESSCARTEELIKNIYGRCTTQFTVEKCFLNKKAFTLTAQNLEKEEKSFPITSHQNEQAPLDEAELKAQENDLFNSLKKGKQSAEAVLGIDTSLFDDNVNGWSTKNLKDDLQDPYVFGSKTENGQVPLNMNGLDRPELSVGRKHSLIPIQKDENDLGIVLFNHKGSPRVIFAVHPEFTEMFEQKMASTMKRKAKDCSAFLRHRLTFIRPTLLNEWKIKYSKFVLSRGEFLVLSPATYFFGYDTGYNVVESVRYHTAEVLPFLKRVSYRCCCRREPLQIISLEGALEKYEPEKLEAYKSGCLSETFEVGGQEKRVLVYNTSQIVAFIRQEYEKKAQGSD